MRNKRWLFVAAVALQVMLLLGMAARHTYTLQTGRPIRLETVPVDPWDMFRGEYVQLRYKISELSAGQIPMTGAPYERGQRVWVTLRQADPYWVAVALSDRKPAVGGGEVALQGRVEWWMTEGGPTGGPQGSVHYGIEQFYVPEGEGPGLEERRLQISVEARVDRFGRAALSRVFVDGKEIEWR